MLSIDTQIERNRMSNHYDKLDCQKLFVDWAQVPLGFCLIRMKHERTWKHVLHLHLKATDAEWHDQPHVPHVASQEATSDSHRDFWTWAAENLPTWDYPHVVKQNQ